MSFNTYMIVSPKNAPRQKAIRDSLKRAISFLCKSLILISNLSVLYPSFILLINSMILMLSMRIYLNLYKWKMSQISRVRIWRGIKTCLLTFIIMFKLHAIKSMPLMKLTTIILLVYETCMFIFVSYSFLAYIAFGFFFWVLPAWADSDYVSALFFILFRSLIFWKI